MGFFKKIGGLVKKATKQVSFKNLVKIGAGFDPTGIVGGLQSQHEEKKQARNDARIEAEYVQQSATKKNPNIGDILIGAGGGALTGAGNVLASSNSSAQIGSTLVESTMSLWFKRNWLKLVGAVLGVVTLIVLFLKVLRPQQGVRRNYRR